MQHLSITYGFILGSPMAVLYLKARSQTQLFLVCHLKKQKKKRNTPRYQEESSGIPDTIMLNY